VNRSLTLILGLAAAAFVGTTRPALAQPAVEGRLAVSLDSFDPGAFDTERRGIVEGSLAPELAFASERGRVYYQLDGGSFNTPGDWSFFNHALGTSYRVDLGGEDRARLFLGGSASWRRNGDAWSDADYDALGGFANLELRPRGGLALRAGYRIADRSFAQLAELNQLEQDTFLSLRLNLPSRTTLIAESHFGWKSYEGETLYREVSASPAAPSGSGPGRGRAGMGPGLRATLPVLVPTGTASEHARQWNALLRVAQGLGERTGAWVQGFVRRTAGRVPPAVVATPAGFFDDGVYDDPYASDLDALSVGLKHIFAGGAQAHARGSWQTKDFTGVVALGADGLPRPGDPLRQDRIVRGGVGLFLPMPSPGAFSLGLALDYGFTRSRSNDAFYDYRTHAVGLALTVSR